MLKNVIFFDFYNTLAKFWPPLPYIQMQAGLKFGFELQESKIKKGYQIADIFFNKQNETNPISTMSAGMRSSFFAEYEKIILNAAGLNVSLELAKKIWEQAIKIPKEFILFDDTINALKQIQNNGISIGIITNLRADMPTLLHKLKLEQYIDGVINSRDAGYEKPDPRIFHDAFKLFNVSPENSLHVGDQYRSDVQGAIAVGMSAVLLDRESFHPEYRDCKTIKTLLDLNLILD